MDEFINFFNSLNDKDRETFDFVVSEIIDDGSVENIKKHTDQLKKIRNLINAINNERNILSQKVRRCESMILMIDKHIANNGETENFSLEALRVLLVEWMRELKDDIILKKPSDLLDKKFKMKESINGKVRRNNLITSLVKKTKKDA